MRTVASMAGFAPRVAHRADSLDLVQDLIVAGLGVGLLPQDGPTPRPASACSPSRGPDVLLRAYAVVRRGRAGLAAARAGAAAPADRARVATASVASTSAPSAA